MEVKINKDQTKSNAIDIIEIITVYSYRTTLMLRSHKKKIKIVAYECIVIELFTVFKYRIYIIT